MRFLLDCGELLEVAGVRYIPGLGVSILSMSLLDDAGFSVVFQRQLIFTYPMGVDPVLVGHKIYGEYVVRGRPTSGTTGWLSESSSDSKMELEQEAPSLDEPLDSQSTGQIYEQDAHSSTSQRLSWYEMTKMDLSRERA